MSAPSQSPVLLEASEVCKFFRAGAASEVRALDRVSLSISRGSFVALTGPSGSGKTTLLALLAAMDRPTSGQLRFEGRDISKFSDTALARLRRRMGFIFQDSGLIHNLPVWENISYPLIPRGVTRAARLEQARRLLGRLGLAEKHSALPSELSGGEQQRVAVARALVGDPEVLFADEPTSNLDRASAASLLAILRDFHERGGTVVVSTHDAELVALAEQRFELVGGRCVE